MFHAFGKNERTFDANDSIEIAMTNMIDYINDMRKKKIDGCNDVLLIIYVLNVFFLSKKFAI